jgi:hypothetical protein
MTGQDNIWRNLQDYELNPPPEALSRLQELLKAEQERDAATGQGLLEGLGHYQVQPPERVRASIEKIIFRKPISFYAWRAAAACILLAIAGWGIYRFSAPRQPLPVAANKTTAPAPANNNAAVAPPALPVIDSNTHAVTKADTAAAPNNTYTPYHSLRIEGQSFALANNDLIATFTSFQYNSIPGFLTNPIDREVKVNLDRYTNLVISRPMAQLLKSMYQLKSNGDPTRRARKRRERLEKWKKADEQYFDQSPKNNPLDPVDLAEILFK